MSMTFDSSEFNIHATVITVSDYQASSISGIVQAQFHLLSH